MLEQLIDASEDCWISALDIAVQKPHSVDKRLAGASEIAKWKGEGGEEELVSKGLLLNIKERLVGGTLENSEEGKGKVTFKVQRVIGRNERTPVYHQLVAVKDGCRAEWWPLDSVSDSIFQVTISSVDARAVPNPTSKD